MVITILPDILLICMMLFYSKKLLTVSVANQQYLHVLACVILLYHRIFLHLKQLGRVGNIHVQ